MRLALRLRRRELQQQAVANLSMQALSGAGRQPLLGVAADALAEGLNAEYTSVLEVQQNGTTVVRRAGHGWEDSSEEMTAELDPTHPALQALGRAGRCSSSSPTGTAANHCSRRSVWKAPPPWRSRVRNDRRGVDCPCDAEARVRREGSLLPPVDRKRVAGALAHERAAEATGRFAAIVESSLDAIVGRTPEGIVTSWNAAAESLFGYSADEMIGRSISILAPPERDAELAAVNDQLMHGEIVKQFETVRIRKDGARIDVASTVSPIKDASGRIVAASAISRDVTARRSRKLRSGPARPVCVQSSIRPSMP